MISPQMLAGIGAVVLLVVTHGYAYMSGAKHKENEHEAELLKSQMKAQEVERKWQGAADAIVKNLEAKRAVTQRNLDIALNGLRDRPERDLSETARPACVGVSGKELARGDAVFLAGYSADAARIQAALDACKSYLKAVTKSK